MLLFAAPALGPAIGGLLISEFGWRSVFLINLPVGIVAWADVRRGRRALAGGGDRGARLDLAGLLLAGGLTLATYGARPGMALGRRGTGVDGRPGAARRLPAPGTPAGGRPRAAARGQPEPAHLAPQVGHAGAGQRRLPGPAA